MTRALNLILPLKTNDKGAPDETTQKICVALQGGGFNLPKDNLDQALKQITSNPNASSGLLPNKRSDDGGKTYIIENTNPSVQDRIEYEVKRSRLIHFLRVLLIPADFEIYQLYASDDSESYQAPKGVFKYIQVLTEFEGTRPAYTDFFRQNLQDVFALIFGLVKGVDDQKWGGAAKLVQSQVDFWNFSRQFNIHALGVGEQQATTDKESEGYLFSAYAYNEDVYTRPRSSERTVQQLQKAIRVQSAAEAFAEKRQTIESDDFSS